ncbi:glycosyltransferase [Conexibacter sp. S30A1]|uniref:UDP-N-acetylglucosamine--N-acetylmuramyl- (pentapeptide) pyrophosphoryl-undecaprenol N-acetylglucosamine transferase n=1 Tax=Conexibacter sp. S30A1 TaxID=2937800 RepID=UPI00200DE65A|nr:UDP-N-acetylglucosamine--N-acetylmuramyl-(pentapeptide) pyrophosphoryl-undecaprenol N-acetylglucosamine transferase [Conexibacter sp. S30A1]
MSKPLIVVATGGTAGHVVPALAVARQLEADGARVEFVGGDRVEARLVPEAGYRLHHLRVQSLPRGRRVALAQAALVDLAAVGAAVRLLARARPQAVYGGGGYVAAPVGLAAALLRIPLVIAEIDAHLGLANRMLAPFARRVCLALPLPEHDPPKFVVTGRPIPPLPPDRAAARARFGVGAGETLVLVFGGSQGARSINRAAIQAFADRSFRVLHAAGERDLPQLRAPRAGYQLVGYLDGLIDAIVACDLAVARSGGSIWELAAAGRPAVLIPYPHATADHQRVNAEYMRRAGAACVIGDEELTGERLRAEVDALLADRSRLEAMGRAALGLARPHAAAVIASEVLAAAAGGSGVAGAGNERVQLKP